MDISKLKQAFTLSNISSNLQRTLFRFPVTLMMLLGLTVLLSYLANADSTPARWMLCLVYFLSVGVVLDFGVSLWGEEQRNKLRHCLLELNLLILWAAYCVWLYFSDLTAYTSVGFVVGNTAWVTAMVLGLPFVSYLREKNDIKAWHFIVALCVAFLFTCIVIGIMSGGITFLIYGTAELFEFVPNGTLEIVLNIVSWILLAGLLFLNLVPKDERKHNASTDMPRFVGGVVKWLLLPLLGCYMLVLYIYGGTILFKWELPNGMLSVLVSAVMAGYVFCYTVLYPQIMDSKTTFSRIFTRWIPALILPLLVLMTVGVIRRFSDYGITAPRLYLLTLLIWYYAVCILIMVLPCKRFHWIYLSFAALFILSSGHPLHYYRISEKIILHKVDNMVTKGIETLSDEEKTTLKEYLRYLRENYKSESVSAYESIDEAALAIATDTVETESHFSPWYVYYTYDNDRSMLLPEGEYRSFRELDFTQRIDNDASSNGLWNLTYYLPNYPERTITFTIDTTAIGLAYMNKEQLFLPTSDNRAVLAAKRISIDPCSDNSDSIVIVRINGYLFIK